MFILQWQCLGCNRTTAPIPVPFGYHPPIPLTELYCTQCREVTSHSAGVTSSDCSPIRTMGEMLAEIRQAESASQEEAVPT